MQCHHHPRCPGCPLLDQSGPEQLATKKARLAKALARYPHLPGAPEVLKATHTEAYRHRVKWFADPTPHRLRMGLQDTETGDVIDTPDCPVMVPALQKAAAALGQALRGARGVVSVDLRASSSTGAIQAVFALVEGRFPGGNKGAQALLQQVPGLSSVVVSEADKDRRKVFGRHPKLFAGTELIDEKIGQVSYKISPGAFFQADPRNALQLHEIVVAMAGKPKTVLDLYAGVGAYGRRLAAKAEKVVAVEAWSTAAEAAAADAPPNFEVIHGNVEDALPKGPFDLGILNPAREGSDPATLKAMPGVAKRWIYVSCGPETLARDLDFLASQGLRVKAMKAVDLFPQTAEVETVVLLEPGPKVERFSVEGGHATGPYGHPASGAVGRPDLVVAMVLGEWPRNKKLLDSPVERRGRVAGHTVVVVRNPPPLGQMAKLFSNAGHPLVGAELKTRRFFADKAGLYRPFLHVLKAGKAWAPLHGDLIAALVALGADEDEVQAAFHPNAPPIVEEPAEDLRAPHRRGKGVPRGYGRTRGRIEDEPKSGRGPRGPRGPKSGR